MILSEHTVICDGCGATGPTSHTSPIDAQHRSRADDWTWTAEATHIKHWCPTCTQARQEQPQ